MSALTIANTSVRQDANGRYCLNDLHRAGGGNKRHKPALWLRSQQAQELIAEIQSEAKGADSYLFPVVSVPGRSGGTFVCDDLLVAYANWISPKFYLRVIRAFKQLTGREATESLGLFRQRLALETKDATSKVRASFGSHLMNDRRRELPAIKDERAKLEEQMQQRLFAFEQERLAAA